MTRKPPDEMVPNAAQHEFSRLRFRALGAIFSTLIPLLLICGCKPKTFRQASSAMAPTIKRGEVVLADMAAYSAAAPARWDVVVFTNATFGQVWCFRVIGLPGESIDIQIQRHLHQRHQRTFTRTLEESRLYAHHSRSTPQRAISLSDPSRRLLRPGRQQHERKRQPFLGAVARQQHHR